MFASVERAAATPVLAYFACEIPASIMAHAALPLARDCTAKGSTPPDDAI
jgi:hypothetical protein